ncbi:MAG: peptidase C10 [Deltaproteobacteria bacterium]|nr:peptidase C10 [Deltaproteobacteria bacterium]
MTRSAGRILARLIVLLIVILLAAVTWAWAKPSTPEQAGTVVANWLALDVRPLGAGMAPGVKEVRSFPAADGSPAYYVVYLEPGGLVIVPADDLVEPIIAFLPEAASYDPSPANPLGALVSNDVPGRVLYVRGLEAVSIKTGEPLAPESPPAKAQRKWAWLAAPTAHLEALEFGLPNLTDVRVAPFVQSRWDQTTVGGQACYNYYTPPYDAGDADNHPSGCVATAMAQLMRYWQRPVAGVGTTAFTIYVDGVPESRSLRGGNGAGGPYGWANMVLVPDASINAPPRQAIGALTHDAGVSVNMNYTSGGSGADTLQSANAFTTVFGYSNARTGYSSASNLPETNRNRMVNPNLHAQYPILFGITGPDGGHAIVCDGYGYQAATMYHHLNMGWAGSYDAWYNLPTIDTVYTFNSVYKCVYNVYVTGSGEIIAGRVTAGGSPVRGATVTATRTGGTVYNALFPTDANGVYAIAKVPSASNYTVSVAKSGFAFPPQSASTGASTNYSTTTGNVWGLDFAGAPAKDIAPILKLLLLD